jgi:DnaJ-class molecular chaperone
MTADSPLTLPPPGARSWRAALDIPVDAQASRPMIETRYRDLAKRLHPDAGGSTAAMAELNAARDQALREVGA